MECGRNKKKITDCYKLNKLNRLLLNRIIRIASLCGSVQGRLTDHRYVFQVFRRQVKVLPDSLSRTFFSLRNLFQRLQMHHEMSADVFGSCELQVETRKMALQAHVESLLPHRSHGNRLSARCQRNRRC